MLVDIDEVLRTLGDESLKTAVLRAVERGPNVKAHPGPQTIYLQCGACSHNSLATQMRRCRCAMASKLD
jgi:hypothetical protein